MSRHFKRDFSKNNAERNQELWAIVKGSMTNCMFDKGRDDAEHWHCEQLVYAKQIADWREKERSGRAHHVLARLARLEKRVHLHLSFITSLGVNVDTTTPDNGSDRHPQLHLGPFSDAVSITAARSDARPASQPRCRLSRVLWRGLRTFEVTSETFRRVVSR